ncbi:MAG: SpoIVB peptidase S55 domain-containing protein [Opitutaceae bacterium]
MRPLRIQSPRRALAGFCAAACAAWTLGAQPVPSGVMALSEIKAGQRGEVWTVFQGTKPEPFSVEVTGVVLNALGPGKSIILCRLTDPRVQDMGAVAGMSGSPLYIDGKFAGALSYQMQRFETVRYAGFTPEADMSEVADRVTSPGAGLADSAEATSPQDAGQASGSGFLPMKPVFALGGVSPRTASIMTPQFEGIGLGIVSVAGSSQGGPAALPGSVPQLSPGDAVSVALTTGDITLAGTGTVSRVDGKRIVAFGHPMLGLGDVQLPLCSAEVVAILPSTMESFKVANIGPVIGCISQDRLSAVSGLLGPGPQMTDVRVVAGSIGGQERTLRFQVVRDKRIAPMIMLTGVVEGIFGSNEAETGEGFRIRSTVTFSPTQQIAKESVYAGQQGFLVGMVDFLGSLSAEIENPFEKALPTSVEFRVEPLESNPTVTVEQFEVSRTTVRAGETFQVTLVWRNFQGAEESRTIDVPVDPSWTGKTLEVLVAPGRLLDELTGHGHSFRPGQLRSFDAYLEAMKASRQEDGLCIAVVERSALFFDEAVSTPDAPASIERIAAAADSARFQRREALVPLWETHVLEGKVSFTDFHRTVRVVE